MGKKIIGIRGINLFISSIAVCLFLTSIWLLYCFIIFKESLYAIGFMLSLSSFTAAVGINIQIFKFIPLDDVIDDKKRGKKKGNQRLPARINQHTYRSSQRRFNSFIEVCDQLFCCFIEVLLSLPP